MTTTHHEPAQADLGQHNGGASHHVTAHPENVGSGERLVALGAGGALIAWGVSRRSVGGTLAAMCGGALIYHGSRSSSGLYHMLGIDEEQAPATRHPLSRESHARAIATIDRPAAELYRFWRDVTNLPRFMRNAKSVERIDDRRSRWRAEGPMGSTIEWQAEITEQREGERIAWRTIEGRLFEHEGSVTFERAPGNRGTRVTLDVVYRPPAGVVGAAASRMIPQDPHREVREDLRRFKQLMEAGEVADSTGPSCRE